MKNTAFTTSLILTAGEAEALQEAMTRMKKEGVNMNIVFAEHGANYKLRGLSINDTLLLIGCLSFHMLNIEEYIEENKDFLSFPDYMKTADKVQVLSSVKDKLTALVHEAAEQNTQQHDMN